MIVIGWVMLISTVFCAGGMICDRIAERMEDQDG